MIGDVRRSRGDCNLGTGYFQLHWTAGWGSDDRVQYGAGREKRAVTQAHGLQSCCTTCETALRPEQTKVVMPAEYHLGDLSARCGPGKPTCSMGKFGDWHRIQQTLWNNPCAWDFLASPACAKLTLTGTADEVPAADSCVCETVVSIRVLRRVGCFDLVPVTRQGCDV
jgi:hypothetical protein